MAEIEPTEIGEKERGEKRKDMDEMEDKVNGIDVDDNGFRTLSSPIDYANKEILAPMVRGSNLSLRKLSLKYGADIVYSDEIIAMKIEKAVRKYNATLDTVDFIKDMGGGKTEMVFRTDREEYGRNVFQMGTPAAVPALNAANMVAGDVSGIDINMGCPKHFSVSGGMGAALLSKPEVAEDILKTLRRNLTIPVTCKVRLLQTDEETVELVRRMAAAGACAVTVHCRTKDMRPHHKAVWERLKHVTAAVHEVPIILNGDVYSREDISAVKELTGASSVMIARGALKNPSIFRREGMLEQEESIHDYVKYCVRHGENYQHMKYIMMQYMVETKKEPVRADAIVKSKSTRDVCAAIHEDLVQYHDAFARDTGYPTLKYEDEFPEKYRLV
uniref:DUS-like FMN-binding domain-containing protein n=1 Tax=Palpitomonas bilix TaxID=652834 RepID=A0A7S3LTN9_9EUKA|mmetsp:Transcript_46205/g.119070  ORF Transcript_46205/g.119070 Transcript_46205/m.119070 type:complete len:387 (+) Transcript_46205:155-1315(+)